MHPALRWEASQTQGISQYRVYRSTMSGIGYELVGGTVHTSFVDALAEAGVSYYYVVAALDTYGVLSPFSQEAKLAIPTAACAGDCSSDGAVTVDELLTGVNMALGNTPVDLCMAFDTNFDHLVTVDELLTGVSNALNGCAQPGAQP
jgi:hypothetical protein